MTIYAIVAGTHDTEYLDFFTTKEKAEKVKREYEKAPSFAKWENLPNVKKARKEWEDYRDELNLLYPDSSIVSLPTEVKNKWFDLASKWDYNFKWSHNRYTIEEIEVID